MIAGVLAHGLCLGAHWYLDDHWQIVESEGIEGGKWWKEHWLQWTYLTYWLTYRCFGMSAPAFHAVNLAIHLGNGCLLYGMGREWLRATGRAEKFALWGALLFVVHPLGSEIANYARCRDLAWVTFFSLAGCWCVLLWLRDGARWLPVLVLLGAGAAYSKGPGLWHFAMMTAVTAAATVDGKMVRERILRWWKIWLVAVTGGGVAFFASGAARTWWRIATGRFDDDRFWWHVLTQCRVFWEFVERFLWPVHLSSDHQIAWTMSARDLPAWAALGGVVLWLGLAGWCWMTGRRRLFGACLLLFIGPILMRVFYVSNELMPEYRIYPGLPWMGLLAAAAMGGISRESWRAVAKGSLVALVILWAGLSARRSTVWWDEKRIAGDVLRQYPAQVRAIWLLQTQDLYAERYKEILERHVRYYLPATQRLQAYNASNRWGRKLDEGIFALTDIGCRGTHARALAELRNNAQAGLAEMEVLRRHMEALQLKDNIFWWTFKYHRGMLYARDGRYEEALRDLEQSAVYYRWRKELNRIRQKAERGE